MKIDVMRLMTEVIWSVLVVIWHAVTLMD